MANGFSKGWGHLEESDTDFDFMKDLIILDLTPKTNHEDLMKHMAQSHGHRVFPRLTYSDSIIVVENGGNKK